MRRMFFVGAWMLASALFTTTPAMAEIRIIQSPGGQVGPFLDLFEQVRESGERVVIDGPCLSACTLVLSLVPGERICVTKRAVLGFHAASYFDDARHTLVPTRQGTAVIMRLYPPEIRDWIERHGGLKPQIMALRGKELSALYNACPVEQVGN